MKNDWSKSALPPDVPGWTERRPFFSGSDSKPMAADEFDYGLGEAQSPVVHVPPKVFPKKAGPTDWSGVSFVDPCAAKLQGIESLKNQIETAQKNFVDTKASYFLEQIKDLSLQVLAKKKAYKQCAIAHGGLPADYTDIPGKLALKLKPSDPDLEWVTFSISATWRFFGPFCLEFSDVSANVILPLQGIEDSSIIAVKDAVHGYFNPGTGNVSVHLALKITYDDDAQDKLKIAFPSGGPPWSFSNGVEEHLVWQLVGGGATFKGDGPYAVSGATWSLDSGGLWLDGMPWKAP